MCCYHTRWVARANVWKFCDQVCISHSSFPCPFPARCELRNNRHTQRFHLSSSSLNLASLVSSQPTANAMGTFSRLHQRIASPFDSTKTRASMSLNHHNIQKTINRKSSNASTQGSLSHRSLLRCVAPTHMAIPLVHTVFPTPRASFPIWRTRVGLTAVLNNDSSVSPGATSSVISNREEVDA